MLLCQQNNGSGLLNFALYQILVKEIGIFQIGRVSSFLYAIFTCLEMPKNGFNRAATQVFIRLFAKNRQNLLLKYKWAYYISCLLHEF